MKDAALGDWSSSKEHAELKAKYGDSDVALAGKEFPIDAIRHLYRRPHEFVQQLYRVESFRLECAKCGNYLDFVGIQMRERPAFGKNGDLSPTRDWPPASKRRFEIESSEPIEDRSQFIGLCNFDGRWFFADIIADNRLMHLSPYIRHLRMIMASSSFLPISLSYFLHALPAKSNEEIAVKALLAGATGIGVTIPNALIEQSGILFEDDWSELSAIYMGTSYVCKQHGVSPEFERALVGHFRRSKEIKTVGKYSAEYAGLTGWTIPSTTSTRTINRDRYVGAMDEESWEGYSKADLLSYFERYFSRIEAESDKD